MAKLGYALRNARCTCAHVRDVHVYVATYSIQRIHAYRMYIYMYMYMRSTTVLLSCG